jgi:RNA-directed DNA polymerase
VQDKRVLKLIGRYLRTGVLIEGQLRPTQAGIPQGGPLSPLLANVVLDELDQYLESRGLRFARYGDDLVICLKSTSAGFRVIHPVTRFLAKRLKLEVNQEKSKGVRTNALEYLGFTFKGKKIVWSASNGRLQAACSAVDETVLGNIHATPLQRIAG